MRVRLALKHVFFRTHKHKYDEEYHGRCVRYVTYYFKLVLSSLNYLIISLFLNRNLLLGNMTDQPGKSPKSLVTHSRTSAVNKIAMQICSHLQKK